MYKYTWIVILIGSIFLPITTRANELSNGVDATFDSEVRQAEADNKFDHAEVRLAFFSLDSADEVLKGEHGDYKITTPKQIEDAERVIFEYLTYLNAYNGEPEDFAFLIDNSNIPAKLAPIPDIGSKVIYKASDAGALFTQVSVLGLNSLTFFALAEACLFCAPAITATGVLISFRSIFKSLASGTKSIQRFFDSHHIANHLSQPGSKVTPLKADFSPLVGFIHSIEMLRVLDSLNSVSDEEKVELEGLLLNEAAIYFKGISRQQSGLDMFAHGKSLAHRYISITAIALSDISQTLLNKFYKIIENNIKDIHKGAKRDPMARLEHMELKESFDLLQMVFEDTGALEIVAKQSGRRQALIFILLGIELQGTDVDANTVSLGKIKNFIVNTVKKIRGKNKCQKALTK